MAYIIRKYSGATLGTISDGNYDDSKTSLTLVGRNYSNYGQIMTDNLVYLLENFARSTAPSNPLPGQLWWDSGQTRLKVYASGTIGWKIISSATAQATAPSTIIAGDLWWDTNEEQLYTYNGTSPFNAAGWILVGPPYKKSKGKSGAIWEQITDTLSSVHDVVVMYLDGVRTGIVSTDSEFTPLTAITGFTTIRPGYNLSSAGTFNGTANNASYLGGQPAANYLRSDESDTTAGALTIQNNSGLTIGLNSNLSITTNSSGSAIITNSRQNGDIDVYTNVGGTSTNIIHIEGSTGAIEVANNPTTASGIATKNYVDNSFVNSSLTGVPTAPTASSGTNTTQLATTAFVQAAFDNGKIFGQDSFIQVNDTGLTAGNIVAVVDGASVFTASQSGIALAHGASAVTQAQTRSSTGNATVATTQYVKTATTYWGGSAKFVSTDEPNPGVNDAGSQNGDFWFQREA